MTPEEFIGLLNEEQDSFRLTIRAHAAVEDKLDDLLRDAFVAGIPDFLARLGFTRKLELIIGLGLVPSSLNDPIGRLTKLRNRLGAPIRKPRKSGLNASGQTDSLALGTRHAERA